ncbi:MAG: hypothetical protein PWP08_178 [Methanofollis sp.]|nr:hypothetical protein [Methanofollis sp.]
MNGEEVSILFLLMQIAGAIALIAGVAVLFFVCIRMI